MQSEITPTEPEVVRAKPRRFRRVVLLVDFAFNVLVGLILLLSLGLRGFAGTAGEDSLLFQLIGYVSIAMLAFGALAALAVVRRSRRLAAVAGAGFIVVAFPLFLFALFPLGLPDLVLGFATLVERKRF